MIPLINYGNNHLMKGGEIMDTFVWKDLYSHFQCKISVVVKDNILHIADRQGKTSLTNAVSQQLIDDIAKRIDGEFDEVFLYHPDSIHSTWSESDGFNHLDKKRLKQDGFKEFVELMKKEGWDEDEAGAY